MNNISFFVVGSIFGAYVAQNYNIPNIEKICSKLLKNIKDLEKNDK